MSQPSLPDSFCYYDAAKWLVKSLNLSPNTATTDSIVQLTDVYLENLIAAKPDDKQVLKYQQKFTNKLYVSNVLREVECM